MIEDRNFQRLRRSMGVRKRPNGMTPSDVFVLAVRIMDEAAQNLKLRGMSKKYFLQIAEGVWDLRERPTGMTPQ